MKKYLYLIIGSTVLFLASLIINTRSGGFGVEHAFADVISGAGSITSDTSGCNCNSSAPGATSSNGDDGAASSSTGDSASGDSGDGGTSGDGGSY